MGVVYKAQDTKLNRIVALKFLPHHMAQGTVEQTRFLQEAQAAAVLNHPNICVIHDVREEDGPSSADASAGKKQFIVMEFVDGTTIREAIKSGPVKMEQAIDYAVQIAEALEEAHKNGIVHRDIKADNIMINSKHQIKVMDFGLAKLKGSLKLTRTSSTVGTLAYMAPEQMQGGDVDPRSDIFSFGVLFFEMLSGRLPFRGEHEAAMMYSIINEDPESIQKFVPDAPAELSFLLKTTLEKNPEDRFQQISDVIRELRRLKKQSSRVNRPAYSGEYQKVVTGLSQSEQKVSGGTPKTANRSISTLVIYAAVGVILVASLITGLFLFGSAESTAFSTFEFSRITSTGKIMSAAISPDNRYICYSQFDKGKYSLWVRQLAATSNIQIKLPQEMYIGDPVFSLDGNYIYYRMREPGGDKISLYKIPVLGGNSVKIVSDVNGRITFSPDGSKIAFNRIYRENGNFALVVATADGSQQKDLVAYKGEKWIGGYPSWSPKGDIIAVALGLWEGGFHHELIGVDAESGEVNTLTKQRWDIIMNSTWMSDGTGLIMEVSDLNKPGVQLSFVSYPSGESRKITNDLNDYGGSSITGDMKKICVVLNEREMYMVYVPEGSTKKARKVTQMRDDGLFGLSFAPDNTLFYVSRQGGDFDIWSVGLNNSEPRQITADQYMETNISVTPNGQTLLFNSTRTGTPSLWKISIDGTGLTQLTKDAEDYTPMMDASGHWIVFSSWIRGPQTIMKIPADGGDRIDVTTENGTGPALSKDGSTVYYISNVGAKNYVSAVSINGGASRRLFEAHKNMTSGIKVRPGTGELSYIITKDGVSNIFLHSAAGGTERQFTDFDEHIFQNFEWTPDGRSVVVSRGEVRSDVVILNDKSK
ncbi:MAG: protein kinase [Bacteroidetes bacterium]|nr:protein kinase [Bacteroidota bacterium]